MLREFLEKEAILMARAKLFYTCTPQVLHDIGGGFRKAFRLNVLDISQGTDRARLLCTVNDVCGSAGQARQLESLLYRNQVSPNHIIDVLENWLP
ncbi:MAG: DUF6514 family protein [Oscillospiraceae bacterium]|nr:DUF6514 family protein [Oscillospiraceae bacterium]